MNKIINSVLTITVFAFLASCNSKMYQPYKVEYATTRVNGNISGQNPEIEKMVTPYRAELDKTMNQVLATSDQEYKKGAYESLLGNWVCDGMKWYMDSVLMAPNDFTICNYGGLRVQSLPKGNITLSNIFELMPFDNKITAVILDSTTMLKAIDVIADFKGVPVSKGIKIVLNKENKIKQWASHQSKKDSFILITTDYIASGGDRMELFAKSRKVFYDAKLRDVLIEYAKHQKKLQAYIEGRIIKENE